MKYIEFFCPNCKGRIRQMIGERGLSCGYCPTDFGHRFLHINEFRAGINDANDGKINPGAYYIDDCPRVFSEDDMQSVRRLRQEIQKLQEREYLVRKRIALANLHFRFPDRKGFREEEVITETQGGVFSALRYSTIWRGKKMTEEDICL